MIKLILTAIVVVATGVFWVWRRYGSKSARIAKAEEKLAKTHREIHDALEDNDVVRYYYLSNKRVRLAQKINRLRG